jgi:hypothetical protein
MRMDGTAQRHVGSLRSMLEKAPEILHPRVHIVANILYSMVRNAVHSVGGAAVI